VRPIDPTERETGGGGGGGGAGPASKFSDADFEGLAEGFATEREILQQGYAEKLALLEDARRQELDLGIDYDDLEKQLHAQHLDEMRALDQAHRQSTLQGLGGMFGDLSSLMQSENEKLFKVGQVAAVAQATLEGYEAAVSAWAKGMKVGGPPLAAAFAAASAIKTGVLISQIAGASSKGGGAAPGGGSGAPVVAAAAAPAAVADTQQININLGGQQLFSREMVLGLIGEINSAVDDGARITVG
jgi:hypothetical protein